MTDTETLAELANELQQLRDDIDALRAEVLAEGDALLTEWRPRIMRDAFLPAAHNLACYLSLRRRDLRPLQQRLAVRGLSSLGRSEAHVLPSLDALAATLAGLTGSGDAATISFPGSARFHFGKEVIAAQADAIFGPGANGRDTRVMVTLPTEAATDTSFVATLVQAGVEAVRINCAHDTPEVWAAMIANLRRAEAAVDAGRRLRVLMDLAGPKIRTQRPPKEEKQPLMVGDRLLLVRDLATAPAGKTPRVACTLPKLLDQLAVGAQVWFDDGKLGAEVRELRDDGALLTIVQAPPKGKKLRSDKGLNLPDTDLVVAPLSEKDRADLAFVARHADMVGYSFVQAADDVSLLQGALADHLSGDRPPPVLVLKIETRRAVRNLPELIVQAAARWPVAVMIARGDLAVELGYERLAEMQEEILWLCEAAYVPVIWATQVLESLAKEGVPSRAEVSDAALADRAECVMLNKGPYIAEAVRLLDDVLRRMQGHQDKKTAQLRELRSWQALFAPDGVTGEGVGQG